MPDSSSSPPSLATDRQVFALVGRVHGGEACVWAGGPDQRQRLDRRASRRQDRDRALAAVDCAPVSVLESGAARAVNQELNRLGDDEGLRRREGDLTYAYSL